MDLKLPHLGEGADSGTVVNLFVKEGDQLAKDQAVLELENEKAVATIPSTAAGTVTKIYIKAGEKLSVGQRILSLSESAAATKPTATAKPEPGREEPAELKPARESAEDKHENVNGSEPKPGLAPAAAP